MWTQPQLPETASWFVEVSRIQVMPPFAKRLLCTVAKLDDEIGRAHV